MEEVNGVVHVRVPKYQIGEEVRLYFKDTMSAKGICEEQGAWVNAEWVKDRKRYRCSNCGHIADKVITVGGRIIEQLSAFCPECGAEMSGECSPCQSEIDIGT